MIAPRRLFQALLIAVSASALFAGPVLARPAEAVPVQCMLPPGAYSIVNSRDELVAVLIVYPDCTTEIVPVRDI